MNLMNKKQGKKHPITHMVTYLHYHMIWMILYVLLMFLMVCYLFFNHIPLENILYGFLISIFLVVTVVVIDFLMENSRRKQLEEMMKATKHSMDIDLEKLPEAKNEMEEYYQSFLEGLYEERRQFIYKEKKAKQDMEEYYAMWVHQIKTPIAAMTLLLQGYFHQLSEGNEALEEACYEWKQSMEEEIFLTEKYVDMALQYQRLESESSDFVFKEYDLDALIRKEIRKHAKLFIRKKLTMNYETINKKIVTDEKWFCFALGQLLSNAIKYTKEGGISIYFDGKELIIEDTGVGISKEDLPRVCEKGYTGYNGRMDKQSTGIGLYLCKKTLEKLSMELRITSELGQGTKVGIRIPAPQDFIV